MAAEHATRGAKGFMPSNTTKALSSPVVTDTAMGLTTSVGEGGGPTFKTAFLEAFSGRQVQRW